MILLQVNCIYRRQDPRGAGTSAAARAAWKPLAALLCGAILLALSIIVYSPLHRDDPQAGGVCPFCQFLSLSSEPAQGQVPFEVPTAEYRHEPVPDVFCHSPSFERHHPGRAPPALLLAS